MNYLFVTNIADKQEASIGDDMTTVEVVGLLRALFDVEEDIEISMTFLGKRIEESDEEWNQQIGRIRGRAMLATDSQAPLPKVFVHITQKRKAVPNAPSPGSYSTNRAASAAEEERQSRKHARDMEPMIDMITQSPDFMKGIMESNPAMKKMMEKHPELRRHIQSPEVLKEMMMASLDPDRRREMDRSTQLQTAQIEAMEGGSQLLNHAISSMVQDMQDASVGVPQDCDLHETSEESCRPDPDKNANTESLPNPWAAVARQPAPAMARQGTQFPRLPFPAFVPNMPAPAHVPQPQSYDVALAALRDMGFEDEKLCLEALRATNGDVGRAVDYIADHANE